VFKYRHNACIGLHHNFHITDFTEATLHCQYIGIAVIDNIVRICQHFYKPPAICGLLAKVSYQHWQHRCRYYSLITTGDLRFKNPQKFIQIANNFSFRI
jgi:hypothetical protein